MIYYDDSGVLVVFFLFALGWLSLAAVDCEILNRH